MTQDVLSPDQMQAINNDVLQWANLPADTAQATASPAPAADPPKPYFNLGTYHNGEFVGVAIPDISTVSKIWEIGRTSEESINNSLEPVKTDTIEWGINYEDKYGELKQGSYTTTYTPEQSPDPHTGDLRPEVKGDVREMWQIDDASGKSGPWLPPDDRDQIPTYNEPWQYDYSNNPLTYYYHIPGVVVDPPDSPLTAPAPTAGADYTDIPGLVGGDPNDPSIIDSNYLPPGGDFDIILGGGESGAVLTPFPIPDRKTLGGTTGVQQSPRSLGRDPSNRSLNISAGYTGIPPGFTGIPGGFTGIPGGYTGVNSLKVNNERARQTSDLARTAGRFNRTLST